MLIVVDQRRIQRTAGEHTGADEVPGGRPDHIGVGKSVLKLMMGLYLPVLLDRFEHQQHEWQNLDEREHRTERDPNARLTGPVEKVARAEDADLIDYTNGGSSAVTAIFGVLITEKSQSSNGQNRRYWHDSEGHKMRRRDTQTHSCRRSRRAHRKGYLARPKGFA